MIKFKRNRSIPLADQAQSPGALNFGNRARKYGARQTYTYRGNTTAVFPSKAHGMAALMDLILMRRGLTVRQYILGGNGSKLRKDRSYSGGQNYTNYLAAMKQKRVKLDEVVDGSMEQLRRLCRAHNFAEGGKQTFTPKDFREAVKLLQERSSYVAGTEVERLVV